MAGKRQAQSDLNHDNWDREEEPEERGTFRTATDDELKNRVIKKAKRKIAPGAASDAADGGSGTKSVFSGFSGFGKATATAATAASSPFSFLSKIPAVAAATSSNNVNSSTATTGATPTFSFGSGSAAATTTAKTTEVSKPSSSFSFGNASATSAVSAPKTSTVPASEKSPFSFSSSSEYYKKLSSLNQAVSDWVKTHVDKNPVCILSPIFKDYEKYLKEIEDERKKEETKDSTVAKDATEKPPQSSSSAGMGSFKFSSSNNAAATPLTTETVAKTNGFSFGLKKPEETSPAKPATTSSFSFGLKPSSSESSTTTATSSSTTAPSSGFSFGNLSSNTNQTDTPPKPFSFTPGATPFSFGNIKPPTVASTATGATNEDEDEEPPKNEFKQVVEDDAVYSKKCKVFVKKDGNFVDKGVGTLYLKPVESSGKTQLIVRADTNLGNILVNLILNSAVPAQRMGKNNVMMVCLPTPDVEKPTSMLLRVKTGEEADELLENIEKYKK
ncbi:nuclear pore complex protein Nup50 [Calliphora vicina]|uniref:nuclear pore complex protein Nup50 n=1 Tax=Calliphora vicina TaxID=7373 RepID=UPI00325A7ECE